MLCNTILKRILQNIILPQLHLQKNLSKGDHKQHVMQYHFEKDFTRHHSSPTALAKKPKQRGARATCYARP
jgi:hypothetical protein